VFLFLENKIYGLHLFFLLLQIPRGGTPFHRLYHFVVFSFGVPT
jgi:hypothetical protein